MSATVPDPPKGYRLLAWHTFPTLTGPWKPSKLHLTREHDLANSPVCGAKPARGNRKSDAYDYEAHVEEAGICKRCFSGERRGS